MTDLRFIDHGMGGMPRAVNLDDIASLPKDPTVPPFGPSDRDDYPEGTRWVDRLTIV